MLDLTKQTIDSCSSSITTKYNKLKSSVTSLTDSLTPCCHYTKPKKSKNNIGSSNDQVKTQQSLHFDDFKLAQNSVYSVQRPRFNVFKTKCSSSYMNKSAITADTTAMDTFCTENQSIR